MNIRPQYDCVVVKLIEEQETTRNAIVIPDSAQKKPQTLTGDKAMRHKGQVGRRTERGKLSEPELTTPEQAAAAGEASRAVAGSRSPIYAVPAPYRAGPSTSGPVHADVGP